MLHMQRQLGGGMTEAHNDWGGGTTGERVQQHRAARETRELQKASE